MPWRDRPLPYYVWISEIMLQQTQVTTVIPYFERFVARFPDVASLAAAEEVEVLRLWEGLGYYRRARQLHRAAREIAAKHGAVFPNDPEGVRSLPGVGRYTAGAILSIAFGQRAPILEANTKRVLSRLLAYAGDPEKAAGQQLLWAFAEALLPRKNVGAFNQALMELGSLICTPKNPRCEACPVAALCPTRERGLQDQIPVRKKLPRFEDVTEAAIVVRRGARIFLRQRGPDERWAGLWDFPRLAVPHHAGDEVPAGLADAVREATGLTVRPLRRLTTLKHGVTRFRITLHCYEAEYVAGRRTPPDGATAWVHPHELAEYPLSVTGRKLGQLLQQLASDEAP